MRLSAEQRYRQATRKALLFERRQLRLLMEGRQQFAEGGKTRPFLIAETERAYQAGVQDGLALASANAVAPEPTP